MPEVFVAVTGEDGAVTYQPADDTVVTSLVKEHPLYVVVTKRVGERDQEIKGLKDKTPVVPAIIPEPAKIAEKNEAGSPVMDVQALIDQLTPALLTRVTAGLQAEKAATHQRDAEVLAALKLHKLPDNPFTRQLLSIGDPAKQAEALSKVGLQFEVSTVEGAVDAPDFLDDVLARMGVEPKYK